jgi:PTS system mannose-specific IIA component
VVGIVIVSHGKLADALILSAQNLVGPIDQLEAVSVWPEDGEKRVKTKIQEKVTKVNDGDGVVILTDILGGTPTNVSLPLLEREKVEIVTGVNIPMLLTLSSYRSGRSLKEIGKMLKKSGRRSIMLAKQLLDSWGRKRWTRSRARTAKDLS